MTYETMRGLLAVSILCVATTTAVAQGPGAPKFGPDAVPIYENLDYIRRATATDYWLLVNFYEGAVTPSGGSAAAAAMAVNALLGVPRRADEQIVASGSLLAQVANQKWIVDTGAGGRGVTFGEFSSYLRESLNAVGLEAATVAATTPADGEPASLDAFRAALAANEASAKDAMLVYFDRGVIAGARGGAQIAPVGAYDEERDLVLVMDVDREWFIPYWTPATTLLVAMVKPVAGGPLAGERGGYFRVARP